MNNTNKELLTDDSIKYLYSSRLEGIINENPITQEDEVNNNWEKLKTNILKAGKEALGKRRVKIPPQTHRRTPWLCDRIVSLAEIKRKAFIQFKNPKTPNSYHTYKGIMNDVNAQIRQIKRDFWESYTKNMERDFYGQQNRIWRMIQNQKRETQEYITTNNNIDKKKWADYFISLYARKTETPRTIPGDINPVEVNEIEIVEAIQKLKIRKSPGEDGITNEMIKQGGPKLWKETTVLIQQIFKSSKIPEDWKVNITIPIFKKGERGNPEN